jgi:hypothetical protein
MQSLCWKELLYYYSHKLHKPTRQGLLLITDSYTFSEVSRLGKTTAQSQGHKGSTGLIIQLCSEEYSVSSPAQKAI